MTKAYYKDAVGAILVYDITNRISYEHMKTKWLSEVKEFCHENITILVVGNKSDMQNNRQVSTAEAAEFAESVGIDFIETSAQSGQNVDIAFRRPVLLIARELPAIKEDISSLDLPEGYIAINTPGNIQKKYMNYWTGDISDILPIAEAETGLCIAVNHNIGGGDTRFRDSSLYVFIQLYVMILFIRKMYYHCVSWIVFVIMYYVYQ